MIIIANKLSGEGGGKSDINELRMYFNSLKTSRKKEFINKLQQKVIEMKSIKYKDFLEECVKTYNQEVKANKAPPTISAESFAIAFASLFKTAKSDSSIPTIGSQLIGTWQRELNGKIFYYKFNDDSTFETNEVTDHEILTGHYNIGIENAILMEPHELLKINSLMLSVSGSSLTIGLTDGSFYEYTRKM